MAQKFAKGGDSAQEAFIETVNALKAIEDPVKKKSSWRKFIWHYVGRYGRKSCACYGGYKFCCRHEC